MALVAPPGPEGYCLSGRHVPAGLRPYQMQGSMFAGLQSHRSDLRQLQPQPRQHRLAVQHLGVLQALGLRPGSPDLHRPLLWKQQPAQLGTVGLVGGQLAPQRRVAARRSGPASAPAAPWMHPG